MAALRTFEPELVETASLQLQSLPTTCGETIQPSGADWHMLATCVPCFQSVSNSVRSALVICSRCEKPGMEAATCGSNSIGVAIPSDQIKGRRFAIIHARSLVPRVVPHSPGEPGPEEPSDTSKLLANFAMTL